MIAALGAVVLTGAASAFHARTHRLDARAVARHLDRTHPALEDSSELVLADDGALVRLERIQRDRVAAALQTLPTTPLPNRPMRAALTAAGIMLAVAAAVTAAASLYRAADEPFVKPTFLPRPARSESGGAPLILRVDVTVRPPAYTGQPSRRLPEGDIEVEQDARVTWSFEADQPVDAFLVTETGDTMPFSHDSLSLVAARPILYRVIVRNAAGLTADTELRQLSVRPDREPRIALTEPPPRTLLAPGESLRIPVRAVADDDYGIAGAEMVATITTGSGESVRFRQERIGFSRRSGRGPRTELQGLLDLAALGLAPGDELYFHVRVWDNRRPEANEGRSDTYFIALMDTASIADAEFAGMPVDRLPEYFRSQRQIIIDTERLIAERSRLRTEELRERSNAIGIDQSLLRIRYGEIVGDETEAGGPDETGHMHDSEENATLLAASVKTMLKAALAEMWQAELELRTHDPEAALPHEYRALARLKEVQQASRVYVQRVGFESPPLEPDLNRLTGDRKGIGDRHASLRLRQEDRDAPLRAVLPLLDELADSAAGARGTAMLEAAGRRLAEIALEQPGANLAAIRLLRRLIDSVDNGATCSSCADSVTTAIWRVLPSPAPTPHNGGRGGASSLSRRYFDLLESP